MTIEYVTKSLISKGFVLLEGEERNFVFEVPKLALSGTNPVVVDIQYGYCTGGLSPSGFVTMTNASRLVRGSENNVWNDPGALPGTLVYMPNPPTPATFDPVTNRVSGAPPDGYPFVLTEGDGTLPPELEPNVKYYSTNFSDGGGANWTAQISLTPGGMPIEFSTAGTNSPTISPIYFTSVQASSTLWGPVEFSIAATNGDVQIIDLVVRLPA